MLPLLSSSYDINGAPELGPSRRWKIGWEGTLLRKQIRHGEFHQEIGRLFASQFGSLLLFGEQSQFALRFRDHPNHGNPYLHGDFRWQLVTAVGLVEFSILRGRLGRLYEPASRWQFPGDNSNRANALRGAGFLVVVHRRLTLSLFRAARPLALAGPNLASEFPLVPYLSAGNSYEYPQCGAWQQCQAPFLFTNSSFLLILLDRIVDKK